MAQGSAEVNKQYFNDNADSYDARAKASGVIGIIGENILLRREWSGAEWSENTTRVLDYACGTGLISQIIAPYTKQIIGMDISLKMVEKFNEKVRDQGIPEEEMRALVADLCADELDPSLSNSEYHNFDVIVCGFAFHHFSNVKLATERLVERLKPNTGVLLVIDFKSHRPFPSHIANHGGHTHHGGHPHSGHGHHGESAGAVLKALDTVVHGGFSQEDMRKFFEGSGLVDVDFVDVGPNGERGKAITFLGHDDGSGKDINMEREVFMVKGRRS
ncbi:S-adenosyl-L-methionine-dependent methyltransferase [Choiromyces venosus 120613-1]|uniref:S-adenosyl-L-methionine-dependent methyltransferase n=1 Tax=Choiromyces venosus 120613-1 TaxID=1336337 RepID=A0A3N4JU28_9PEZI|nr:S-adenosyl-L-methionine-dependent methyltransferase [Choiromyces venosus 120613-1]